MLGIHVRVISFHMECGHVFWCSSFWRGTAVSRLQDAEETGEGEILVLEKISCFGTITVTISSQTPACKYFIQLCI